MKTFTLTINGLPVEAQYKVETIEKVFVPLLQDWTEKYREKQERVLIFLAAPPAVGKTTLSHFLEHLSTQIDGVMPIQSIGLDGFHHHASYLSKHKIWREGVEIPMKDVKGCPETFDIEKLLDTLEHMKNQDIKWPIYDRNLHDVIEDVVSVTGKIVLLEGNWLLLKDEKWNRLRDYCDQSIMITADESMLRERLVHRKILGGLSEAEAQRFYERSDSVNVTRVLKDSFEADITLAMTEDGDYHMREKELR